MPILAGINRSNSVGSLVGSFAVSINYICNTATAHFLGMSPGSCPQTRLQRLLLMIGRAGGGWWSPARQPNDDDDDDKLINLIQRVAVFDAFPAKR